MNKYIYKTTLFLMACFLSVACSENFMDSSKGSDVLTLKATCQNDVLLEKNHSADGIILDWTTGTNNGTGNKISYTLEFAVEGTEFANPVILDLGTECYEWSKTVGDLNDFLVQQMGVRYNETVSVEARVIANVTGHDEMTQTSSANFTVTTYEPVTSTLYMIGDATPTGWNADSPTEMIAEDKGLFTWTGKLKSNASFKFITTKGNFVPSYNRDGNDASGTKLVLRNSFDEPDEAFSVAEEGNYSVTVDLLEMTISVKVSTDDPERFENVYFVGSFSDWNFIDMTKDVLQLNFWHYGAVFNWNNGGEFKFGTVKDWNSMLLASEPNAPYTSTGVVYNNSDDNKWLLTESQCGKAYKIWLNVTKGKEKMIMKPFDAYPMLYLVGDATPNGWALNNATAMTKVTDYEFSWTGTLNAGEMKISCDKQDDWNGAWFLASKSGKSPDGTDEYAVFVDKSDEEFKAMYPDVAIGDVDMKWKISDSGTYKITINQLTETISIVKQ